MGASISHNSAEAVAKVSNDISQITKADSDQVSNIINNTSFNNCVVDGNVSANTSATVVAKSKQIIQAKQNSSLQNQVSQQIAQQAQSKLGALAFGGFAVATNNVSQLTDTANTVAQTMDVVSSQNQATTNNFTCENSHVFGNVDIDYVSDQTFLSDQTLTNDQTTQIINQISQVEKQKAIASVTGFGSLLIGIIACIIAGTTLKSKGEKDNRQKAIIAIVIIVVIVAILFGVMYLLKAPPFFSNNNLCAKNSAVGGCTSECVEYTEKTFEIQYPPLRYLFPSIENQNDKTSLLNMVIYSQSKTFPDNQGLNSDTHALMGTGPENTFFNQDTSFEIAGVPQLPNPLKVVPYQIPVQYLENGGCSPGVITYDNLSDKSFGMPWQYIASGDDDRNKIPCQKYDNWKTNTRKEDQKYFPIPQNKNDPQPLIAIPNIEEYKNYVNTGSEEEKQKRANHVRFVLSRALGFPTDVFTTEGEEVSIVNPTTNISMAELAGKKNKKETMLYQPTNPMNNLTSYVVGPGKMNAFLGNCNDNTYKFHKFMKGPGIAIYVILLILTLFSIYFYSF